MYFIYSSVYLLIPNFKLSLPFLFWLVTANLFFTPVSLFFTSVGLFSYTDGRKEITIETIFLKGNLTRCNTNLNANSL